MKKQEVAGAKQALARMTVGAARRGVSTTDGSKRSAPAKRMRS